MNKEVIISRISWQTGLSKKEVEKILNSMLHCIEDATSKGETTSLVGFGQFKFVSRKGRLSAHPKTQKPIYVPPKMMLKFFPGTKIKAAIALCNTMKNAAKKSEPLDK